MGLAIRDGSVDADGFRIRYQEAGEGPPVVHLHGAHGLGMTSAHELLSRSFRLIAFEMPGFGATENQKTQRVQELATTMAAATPSPRENGARAGYASIARCACVSVSVRMMFARKMI